MLEVAQEFRRLNWTQYWWLPPHRCFEEPLVAPSTCHSPLAIRQSWPYQQLNQASRRSRAKDRIQLEVQPIQLCDASNNSSLRRCRENPGAPTWFDQFQ